MYKLVSQGQLLTTKIHYCKLAFIFRIFLFISVISSSSAQIPTPLRFESLTINDGLSQGYVSSMVQDKRGLMWFATSDGLNKYDGETFTIYHHDPDDTTSIASDDLTCVFEDSKGRLWVGTRNDGLDYFDSENNVFVHFRHGGDNTILSDNVLEITEDKIGGLWVRSKGGINHLDIADNHPISKNDKNQAALGNMFLFTPINLPESFNLSRKKYNTEKIFIDSRNRIFLTTNNSLWELYYNNISRSYKVFLRYSFPDKNYELIPNMFEDPDRRSLLLDIGNIVRFDDYKFDNGQIVYNYNSFQVQGTTDKRKKHWLADKRSIAQLDLQSGRVLNVISQDPAHMKIINYPNCMYTDRKGVVWIASGGYGLLKYDPEKELFHHILPELNTYQLIESGDGEIITNTFKLIKINKNKPISVSQLIDTQTLTEKFPKHAVFSFSKDNRGNLWVGINGGLIRYSLKTRTTVRIPLPFKDFVSLPFPIYVDGRDHVWMGYNKHLVRYIPATGEFSQFDYPVRTQNFDYDFLQCIYEDQGILWLGSVEGVFAFDTRTETMISSYSYVERDSTSLSNNFILSICNDFREPHKFLWVGTKGGGLNRLNKYTGEFARFSRKEGLANNVVYGILPDDNGNLWLSTNYGLSEYTMETNSFRNFSISDGLQSNEFNRYAFCKTKEGLLVFGGGNGLNYFDPKEIRQLDPPDVIFTDFRLYNKKVDFRVPGAPLVKDIAYTNNIVLQYNQNVITFVFAGMDFRKKGNIRYRYKMEGFDENWNYSGTSHEATYTNLDPGDYRFVVQGSFINGRWGNKLTTMGLHVISPWWRTWWFYILATTSSLSGTYILYRYRLHQLTRYDSLRNRIARDLHDEVGSSISTIAIYSKIVHEQVGSSNFNNEPLLKKITEHATEIMESMNDIVWNINTKNDAFENIIRRMREHAYQLFEAKGYTIHFEFDEDLYKMKLEMEKRRDFYLIYKEALNNVAKYANGKNVWITVNLKNSKINLIVSDDGQGFDPKALREKSNGLGNMNYRAEALNGKLEIISSPGAGTVIFLSF